MIASRLVPATRSDPPATIASAQIEQDLEGVGPRSRDQAGDIGRLERDVGDGQTGRDEAASQQGPDDQ